MRWPVSARWLPALIVLVGLLAWEGAVTTGRLPALFYPAPSTIARRLLALLQSGELLLHLRATLGRLLGGLLVGGLPGLLLGLTMGWSARLRALLDPFVAAAHPIPKVAIFPLLLIIFGIGESATVAVAALGAFFPLLINAMAGVQEIHPLHFEVAENYGARPLQVFTRVVLPGSLPLVLTGLRLAINTTLLLVIAVEMVGARQGLGALIWFGWETMRTEELYSSLVVIVLLGLGFNLLLLALLRLLIPWQNQRR